MALFADGNPLIAADTNDFVIDRGSNPKSNVMIGLGGSDVLIADYGDFFTGFLSQVITDFPDWWNKGESTNILNSMTVPHTTIYFEPTVPQVGEWFVEVDAGDTITIDVDFGDDGSGTTNTVIELYTSDGATLLSLADDSPVDIGSAWTLDSFLQYTFGGGGTYLIRVREINNLDGSGTNFDVGDNFLLNISLTGQAVAAIPPKIGNDTLYGGSGSDAMYGNGGNDTFYGGLGQDAHYGGTGVDTVRYDDGNYGDITIVLDNPAFNSDGVAGGDSYYSIENVAGGSGNDTIIGDSNVNQLFGEEGNDTLDGGIGADTTEGGVGDDKHIVDNALDKVIEVAGGGTSDIVFAKVNYTLAAGVDVEFLQTISVAGTGAMTLVGNEKGQSVLGNAGANSLYGGGGADTVSGFGGLDFIDGQTGHDTLTGGADVDRFVFRQPGLSAANSDLITDFSAQDEIWFDTATGTGAAINPATFVSGSAALGPEDRFIYNQSTGQLSFDSDGTGGTAQILFATLGQTTHFALTAADIILF